MEKQRDTQSVMNANSVQSPRPQEAEEAAGDNGKPSPVRTASKEQFDEAQRKTSKLHAGLFRRLAK